MQKIMFNDRFSLTDLVLSGQKTQTRRIIKLQDERLGYLRGWNLDYEFAEFGRERETPLRLCPKYYVGEMVAVAMSYKSIYKRVAKNWEYAEDYKREHENLAGWNNKMFTNTKMPFAQIKITNIRVERLQDISDEDCMREGIRDYEDYVFFENFSSRGYNNVCYYSFLRDAFADLINRISGKGTWESNPWVWVYDFELAK
jgi:hypothetical protein